MINVEDIYFYKNELIRAASIDGDYEDFMIMSTEFPVRYCDFTTVDNIYIGDTDHCDDKILTQRDIDNGAMKHTIPLDILEEMVDTAKTELKKAIKKDEEGYVYICRREDDDFAVGICPSTEPLKKATEEEWQSI